MSVTYVVHGRRSLHGRVEVQGLPGAAIAGMAAALLTSETVTLRKVPHLPVLDRILTELRELGVAGDWTRPHELTLQAGDLQSIPLLTTSRIISRIPLLIAGILLRSGVCRLELHAHDQGNLMQFMDMIRRFGGLVEVQDGLLRLAFPLRHAARIDMREVDIQTCLASMLMAASAEGPSELVGMPIDPQISALSQLLADMGAPILSIGDAWQITGAPLHGLSWALPGDLMDAGFLALAAAATDGDVVVRGLGSHLLTGFLGKLRAMGIGYRVEQNELRFWKDTSGTIRTVSIEAGMYPDVPASWLPMLLPILVQAEGEADIRPVTDEVRATADMLRTLGAEFYFGDSSLRIFGPVKLAAGTIEVRSGGEGVAALLSALSASGISRVHNMELVEGQFEHLFERLQELGAKLERLEE